MKRALESLKKFHLNELLFSKVYIVWAKKVRRISLKWRRIKNSERNQLIVSKLAYGIWQNLTATFQSLKDLNFNGLLLSKVYIITEEYDLMKLKRDTKFGERVVSKLTKEIWQILTWAHKCLKNFHFNGLLFSKVYIVWAKTV